MIFLDIMNINSPVHLFELSFELIFWFWQVFNFDRELKAFYIYNFTYLH